jgi:H+/Cl- antiporter ClcA
MALEGTNMLYMTLQKQRPYWCKRITRNKKDTIGEGITIGLILFLGIISIANSIGIVVYSVALVVNKQLVLMELLRTLVVAGLLLAIGLASLYFFRKKLRMLTRKKNPWEL